MRFIELVKQYNLTQAEALLCYKYLLALRMTNDDIELLNKLRVMTTRILK